MRDLEIDDSHVFLEVLTEERDMLVDVSMCTYSLPKICGKVAVYDYRKVDSTRFVGTKDCCDWNV